LEPRQNKMTQETCTEKRSVKRSVMNGLAALLTTVALPIACSGGCSLVMATRAYDPSALKTAQVEYTSQQHQAAQAYTLHKGL
jgi:hypothetical protein